MTWRDGVDDGSYARPALLSRCCRPGRPRSPRAWACWLGKTAGWSRCTGWLPSPGMPGTRRAAGERRCSWCAPGRALGNIRRTRAHGRLDKQRDLPTGRSWCQAPFLSGSRCPHIRWARRLPQRNKTVIYYYDLLPLMPTPPWPATPGRNHSPYNIPASPHHHQRPRRLLCACRTPSAPDRRRRTFTCANDLAPHPGSVAGVVRAVFLVICRPPVLAICSRGELHRIGRIT